MIPIVKSRFFSEGEIFYGKEFLTGYLTKKIVNDFSLILVENFNNLGFYSWHLLDSVFKIPNIEEVRKNFVYKDPWSDNTYYWWFPQWLFVKDVEFYRSYVKVNDAHWWDDRHLRMLLDKSLGGSLLELSRVTRAFLGHGFSANNMPCDGYGSIREFLVMLSNGDYIVGHGWEWHSG